MEKKAFVLFNKEFTDKYITTVRFLYKYIWWFVIPLFLLLFYKNIFNFTLIAILILVGGFSQIYKLVIPFPIGFELMTLSSITILFWTNPAIAWICTMIMVLITSVSVGRIDQFLLIRAIIYTITIIIMSFFLGLGIVAVGIISIVLLNILYLGLSAILEPQNFFVSYANVLNIVINIFLFRWFGEFLLGLFL